MPCLNTSLESEAPIVTRSLRISEHKFDCSHGWRVNSEMWGETHATGCNTSCEQRKVALIYLFAAPELTQQRRTNTRYHHCKFDWIINVYMLLEVTILHQAECSLSVPPKKGGFVGADVVMRFFIDT